MSQYSCAKKDDKSSEGRAFGLKGRRKSAGSGNRKYLPYLRLAAKRIQVIAPAFRCERRRAGFGSIERAAKSGFGNRRRRIAIGGRENTGDRPDGILMPTNSLTRLSHRYYCFDSCRRSADVPQEPRCFDSTPRRRPCNRKRVHRPCAMREV